MTRSPPIGIAKLSEVFMNVYYKYSLINILVLIEVCVANEPVTVFSQRITHNCNNAKIILSFSHDNKLCNLGIFVYTPKKIKVLLQYQSTLWLQALGFTITP